MFLGTFGDIGKISVERLAFLLHGEKARFDFWFEDRISSLRVFVVFLYSR
jgi:hypothetical protein